MCSTLGGLAIEPIRDLGPDWRDRKDDLKRIIQAATDHFVPTGARFPFGNQVGYEERRYIPGGDADPAVRCSFGIGTRFGFEAAGGTPFWLRYQRRGPGFPLVNARLTRSPLRPHIRTDDRHLWLPLPADPDAAGPELVSELVEQIAAVITAASS